MRRYDRFGSTVECTVGATAPARVASRAVPATQTAPRPTTAWSARLVDAHSQGWAHQGRGRYLADYARQRGLPELPHGRLLATRGPLRPVQRITDDGQQATRAALRMAGPLAVTTLVVALADVATRLATGPGGPRVLMAGQETAWESQMLAPVVSWGYHLDPARVHGPAAGVLTTQLVSWVTDPHRYTEVAQTLTEQLAHVVDTPPAASAAAAWARVADAALQPGGADAVRGQALYLFLMAYCDTYSAEFADDLYVSGVEAH